MDSILKILRYVFQDTCRPSNLSWTVQKLFVLELLTLHFLYTRKQDKQIISSTHSSNTIKHQWSEFRTHRILSNQLNHVFSKCFGTISKSPFPTSSAAFWAISLHFTNHCGLTRNSTTSLDRLHTGIDIGWGWVPLKRSICWRRSRTTSLALNRGVPAYSPQMLVRWPLSSTIWWRDRRWRCPTSKSVGSWPGVTFTAPWRNEWTTIPTGCVSKGPK